MLVFQKRASDAEYLRGQPLEVLLQVEKDLQNIKIDKFLMDQDGTSSQRGVTSIPSGMENIDYRSLNINKAAMEKIGEAAPFGSNEYFALLDILKTGDQENFEKALRVVRDAGYDEHDLIRLRLYRNGSGGYLSQAKKIHRSTSNLEAKNRGYRRLPDTYQLVREGTDIELAKLKGDQAQREYATYIYNMYGGRL